MGRDHGSGRGAVRGSDRVLAVHQRLLRGRLPGPARPDARDRVLRLRLARRGSPREGEQADPRRPPGSRPGAGGVREPARLALRPRRSVRHAARVRAPQAARDPARCRLRRNGRGRGQERDAIRGRGRGVRREARSPCGVRVRRRGRRAGQEAAEPDVRRRLRFRSRRRRPCRRCATGRISNRGRSC